MIKILRFILTIFLSGICVLLLHHVACFVVAILKGLFGAIPIVDMELLKFIVYGISFLLALKSHAIIDAFVEGLLTKKSDRRDKNSIKVCLGNTTREFYFLCSTDYGGRIYQCELGHLVHAKDGIVHWVQWNEKERFLYDRDKHKYKRQGVVKDAR